MLALDLWYGFGPKQLRQRWYFAALVALLGLTLGSYPLINLLFDFPTISTANLFMVLVTSLLAGLAGTWLGSTISQSLRSLSLPQTAPRPGLGWISPLVLALLMAFMIVYISTAKAPV
jgi:hypothetical protein